MHIRLNASIKLFISYIIILTMVLFGWSVFGTNFFENRLIKDTKSEFYNTLSTIAGGYIKGHYKNNLSDNYLSTELDIISEYIDSRILFAKTDGNLIYDSQHSVPVNLFSFENDIISETYCYNITLPGFIDQPFLSVSYPITDNMKLRGHIIMIKDCNDIFNEADAINRSYWPLITIISIIITLAFIIAYIRLIRPLKKLVKISREYSNKKYDTTFNIKASKEYHEIFDSMSCISDDLKNVRNEQRTFLSNISHDFRSPLTSIRGYTEALIDGTIPPEMSEKYLKIMLFETERLTKLTSGLLELSKFDNTKNSLDISPFDINATIKQTVAFFEVQFKEKQLHAKLVFEEPKTYVVADLGKIQQVIYNLIDNAIKFSKNKTDIIISTTIMNEKIMVSIKDSGIGISKESLPKIWDRFYKSDTSRGKDKKGTGLGLSIVKEIINSHGENINVTSTIDVGTEFTFSLPRKSV